MLCHIHLKINKLKLHLQSYKNRFKKPHKQKTNKTTKHPKPRRKQNETKKIKQKTMFLY